MANALKELLASFGINVDTRALDKADGKVTSFEQRLGGLATKMVGVFAVRALSQYVGSTIEATAHTDDLANRLGLSVDELQRFQYEALLSGVSADDAATSLKFLNKHLGEAASGAGTGAQDFASLGVSVRDASGNIRPAAELMPDLADGFAKLGTDGERTEAAMKLFGRGGAALIPLLKHGRAGVAKLSDEFDSLGGGLSSNTVKSMAEADDQLDRLKFSGRLLSTELIAALVPGLTKLVGWITQGIGAFREFAKSSDSVTQVLEVVAIVAGAALLVWALLNIEVIAAVAIFALLVLAAQDVWKTFEGGDTVTRRVLDNLLGFGATKTVIDGIAAAFAHMKLDVASLDPDLAELKDALSELGVTAPSIDVAAFAMRNIKQEIRGAVMFADLLTSSVRMIVNLLTSAAKIAHEVADAFNSIAKALPDLNARGLGGTASNSLFASVPHAQNQAANTAKSISQSNDISIVVHALGGNEGAGNVVGGKVKETLEAFTNAYAATPGGG